MGEGQRYAMYLATFCFIATAAPLLLYENQSVFGYLFGGVLVFLGLSCLYAGLKDGKEDKEYEEKKSKKEKEIEEKEIIELEKRKTFRSNIYEEDCIKRKNHLNNKSEGIRKENFLNDIFFRNSLSPKELEFETEKYFWVEEKKVIAPSSVNILSITDRELIFKKYYNEYFEKFIQPYFGTLDRYRSKCYMHFIIGSINSLTVDLGAYKDNVVLKCKWSKDIYSFLNIFLEDSKEYFINSENMKMF